MPTGYTAGLTDTTTLEQFVLTCARAFGALIHMRDDDSKAEIREDTVSDYYPSRIAAAEAQLGELRSLTGYECAKRAADAYRSAVETFEKARADARAARSRYDRMLSLVAGWQPPTPEHQGMKAFMIEQLTSSRDADCGSSDEEAMRYWTVPQKVTGVEWIRAEMTRAERELSDARTRYAEERKRVAGRNEWIHALLDSLKATP